MKSELGKLNFKDIAKGFLMAFLGVIVAGSIQAINTGNVEFTWLFFKPIVLTALSAGLAYILKNWLSNSDGNFLKSESKENSENVNP